MPHTLVVSGGETVLCTKPTIAATSGGKESLGFSIYVCCFLSFLQGAYIGKFCVVFNEFLRLVEIFD